MNTLLNETAIKSRVAEMLDALNPEEQRAVFRFTEYLYLSVEVDEVRPGEVSAAEEQAIRRSAEGGETFIPWDEADGQPRN